MLLEGTVRNQRQANLQIVYEDTKITLKNRVEYELCKTEAHKLWNFIKKKHNSDML